MTSGLPPAAALPRRAGTFVPPSVAAVLSLPVSLVFVGTVLLSVVLGAAEFVRVRLRAAGGGRRTPANRPLAGHGKPRARQGDVGDPPWACRHPDKQRAVPGVPGLSSGPVRRPARPPPPPPRQPGSGTPARGSRSGPCPGSRAARSRRRNLRSTGPRRTGTR